MMVGTGWEVDGETNMIVIGICKVYTDFNLCGFAIADLNAINYMNVVKDSCALQLPIVKGFVIFEPMWVLSFIRKELLSPSVSVICRA
jgi:hypothetical protein